MNVQKIVGENMLLLKFKKHLVRRKTDSEIKD